MALTVKQRRWVLGAALALTLTAVASIQGNDKSASVVVQPSQIMKTRHPQQKDEADSESAGSVVLAKLDRQPLPEDVKDMFAGKSWYAAPPSRPASPAAPPLPFVYTGKLAEEGEKAVIVLTRENRSYTVSEGDVLDNTYRVDEISAPVMTLTYLPLNIKQTIRIGEPN
jgi:hypothetical protein